MRGKRRNLADGEVFFGPGGFAGGNAFGDKECSTLLRDRGSVSPVQ